VTAALAGRHKAAVALLSLDEEVAAQVLAKMSDEDVRRVVAAVEELENIDGEMISGVLEELERGLESPLATVRTSGGKYIRKLADRAFGNERAQKLLAGELPPPVEPLELLRTARVGPLAELLGEENPQIAAVVLTQLPAKIASNVIALMPEELGADLMARISALEEIPEHAVAEASESLVRALEVAGGLAGSDARAEFDGLAFSAEIVNYMSSEAGDGLLGRVATLDETAAARIREAMFTFEDLRRIAAREMGALLRSVQTEVLVTAMQAASSELRDHLLSALSQRAASTLRDDLASATPKRLSEVEAAQREIVEAALRLAGEGKLTMPERGGE
jgi:flagellar motor switch protein FliG